MSSLQTLENLTAYDGGGVASDPDPATGYVTLDADTHYFPVPMAAEAEVVDVQLMTGAAIAGSFYLETSSVPVRKHKGVGASDATDYNETAGVWVKLDPDDAYVPVVGAGWTVTNATAVKTAAAGGAALWTLSAFGGRRLRLVAVVTTGGTCRVVTHSKGRV
jgi:hypothetical protein